MANLNIYFKDNNGNYVPQNSVEELDLTVDSEVMISPEPITGTIHFTTDCPVEEVRKLIPVGYRNAENLKRDGFLNPSNAEFE